MTAFRTLAMPAAAALVLCGVGSLRAADMPYIPPPGSPGIAAPMSPAMPAPGGCPTCGGAATATSGKTCATCGSSWFHHHDKGPYVVNLCPGACFGYFQTQWRKWDDVCPYPYQGIGVSDSPRPPSPAVLTPKTPTLTPPRPIEPKTSDSKPMSSSGLPPIPAPGGY